MHPPQALDSLRFCIEPESDGMSLINLECGISQNVAKELTHMGHEVCFVEGYNRALFGRGQVIRRLPFEGVLEAGSDPRADGCAYGW